MNLHQEITTHLNELCKVLSGLSAESYTYSDSHYPASIGKHIRHTIELFTLLEKQYEQGQINYDLRQRDLTIETDKNLAIEKLNFIIQNFEKPDKPLTLISNGINIPTSYHRELLYQLEHIIHHNAIIKPLLDRFAPNGVSENFGYAPSTIKFQSQHVSR